MKTIAVFALPSYDKTVFTKCINEYLNWIGKTVYSIRAQILDVKPVFDLDKDKYSMVDIVLIPILSRSKAEIELYLKQINVVFPNKKCYFLFNRIHLNAFIKEIQSQGELQSEKIVSILEPIVDDVLNAICSDNRTLIVKLSDKGQDIKGFVCADIGDLLIIKDILGTSSSDVLNKYKGRWILTNKLKVGAEFTLIDPRNNFKSVKEEYIINDIVLSN